MVGLMLGLVSIFAERRKKGNRNSSLSRRKKERKKREARRKLWKGKDVRELWEILKDF